jgi:L-iditol 2-dehydrogenase
MNKTMQAAVLVRVGEIALQEIPVPVPGEGEVLVRVRAATTCGTDLKLYSRGHPKFPPPLTLGHEFAGEIAALGPGVEGFAEGMRVTANVFGECGACFYCTRGQGNLCERLVYNFGAFAEYNLIPASIVRKTLFPVPDGISDAEAAVLEPLVCVVHAFNKIKPGPGERVVVIGAGGAISLLFIQMLKLAGVEDIIAVGHSDFRLRTAAQLGAAVCINAKKEDQGRTIRGLTDGRGADVVIECAGTRAAWEEAVDLTRPGGRVLWFGGLPGGTKVALDAGKVHYGGIDLYNSHGGSAADAQQAAELVFGGNITTGPLISEELPLAEIERAFQKMRAGEVVKVAVIP